uniref:SPIN-DOC-like zinc-finger domain-containing protein n=1 Tax=Octopus bimaculoides TaxID=37653 RepID=A0A0L8G6W5_OCTBM
MSAAKEWKIDDEGRIFNNKWSNKHLVVQLNKGVVCVICQTTIAIMKEYNIKHHNTMKHSTIHDILVGQARVDKLEQMSIFTDSACAKNKHLLQQTSLSHFTVSNRINQFAENIEETSKESIIRGAAYSLALDESKGVSDTAQLVVFVRGVIDNFEITEEFLDMTSMSSTTTGQDISEQILKLMEEFQFDPSELCDLTTDGASSLTIDWLSRAATLKRFWNLRKEIGSFMINKQQGVAYLNDDDWLNNIAFLPDITQYLSYLNVKLQGESQLMNKMSEHIWSFEKKVQCFQTQLSRTALNHFSQSSNFRKCETEFKLFSQPFDMAPEGSPGLCQMELIDLQSDMDLGRAYNAISAPMVTFNKNYVCGKHPNLEQHARKMTSLSGSTYCEQVLSRMKFTRNR